MADSQAKSAERVARQNRIDEMFVEPLWSKYVDIPLLEMCCACSLPPHPVILLPELRFRSLLRNLVTCLSGHGKLMIVDNTNARFESLRQSVNSSAINMYFSTQEMSALNYADNSFHFALTELGVDSLCRADVIFSSYRRVLKPGGHLIWSSPIKGSFPAFFDILEECLYTMDARDAREIMQVIDLAMNGESILKSVQMYGYTLEGSDVIDFEISFPSAEQLLFSTLIESHYLGYCLSLLYPNIKDKALLTVLIRAFHQYFQGEVIRIPFKMGLYSARKM